MTHDKMSRLALASFLPAICLGQAVPALAQSVTSRTVPETIAPRVERVGPEIVLPETHLSVAPEGADAITVTVSEIVVDGLDPAFTAEVGSWTGAAENRTVSVAELYAIAGQIEALYARDGRVLTRATVPPQELSDGGTFRIVIVEGFIEAVDSTALPPSIRDVAGRRLAPLVGVPGLTLKQIERRVLLAASLPGATIATTIIPGDAPGGARLVVSGQHRPFGGEIGADNRLGDAYDNWSVEARVSLNSAFDAGETIYALGASTTDFNLFQGDPLRRLAGAGVAVPLGNDGLVWTSEYLTAETNPRTPPGALPIRGTYDRWSSMLTYPVVLTRSETLSVAGGFEAIDEAQDATGFGVRLSEDRLRIVNANLDWTRATGPKTSLGMRLQFAQGLNGLGARDQADALRTGVLLSRQGSQPDFSKIGGTFNLTTGIAPAVEARLVLRGQASLSGALPGAVQFSLDSDQGLSGFDLGTINVDSGVTARAELSHSWAPQTGFAASPYLFAAAGTGTLSQPTVLEREHPDGWSLGGGIRTLIADRLRLDAELARSHSNLFSGDVTRFTISAAIQF